MEQGNYDSVKYIYNSFQRELVISLPWKECSRLNNKKGMTPEIYMDSIHSSSRNERTVTEVGVLVQTDLGFHLSENYSSVPAWATYLYHLASKSFIWTMPLRYDIHTGEMPGK